jgi:hypothetical protein
MDPIDQRGLGIPLNNNDRPPWRAPNPHFLTRIAYWPSPCRGRTGGGALFCPLGVWERLCALAMLHVIVLEPGKIYKGNWFFGQPTMENLRQDVRALTRKCRTDWDITTPEFKEAWQQRRTELFYPYGKTYVRTLGEQD